MDVFSDVKFIAALVSLVGILLAAIISSAGYFYKNWTESKRSARKVLYLLLEIRYAINISLFSPSASAEKFMIHYSKRMEERGLQFDLDVAKKSIMPLIIKYFTDMSNSLKVDIEKRLLTPYDNALMELAAVNPVLAYQLRGKDKFDDIGFHVNRYTDSIRENLPKGDLYDWMVDLLENEAKEVSNSTISKLALNFDSDILRLARYCGRRDLRNSKYCIDNSYSTTNDIDFSELDEMIDLIIDKCLDEYTKKEFIKI
ncbi:hypothetical protein ONV78_04915 [Hahella sp. CR1]|uniref:hypothetical protein n=1 Tax=Hahella sp. CR1 TaxID=2992807 RepID=UPI0024419225|nr:hypothetical protein [Hahella sp. CR1]MDG9667069.1 hypothetical protein [Hahella sp. CR1]